MTPRCTITSVVLVLLLFFEVGYLLPMSEADPPTIDHKAILDSCSFATSTCNLSSELQEPNMFLRNMKDSLKDMLNLNVIVDLNDTAKATNSASFLTSAHRETYLTDEIRYWSGTQVCASDYQYIEDHAHPPSWRANAALIIAGTEKEPVKLLKGGAEIECQCEAVVAPFNVLTFTCSEGQEKFTWTTKSAIVGYTCVGLNRI